MLPQIPTNTFTTLSLLLATLATSTTIPEYEPQILSNITISLLNPDDGFTLADNSSLNARALECSIGYTACAYDSSRCCLAGQKCCGNGYCARIGAACCVGGGTCPVGYKCCDGSNGCAPWGGECCSGGYYCPIGKRCRIYKGEKVCCGVTGCAGEYDGIGSGGTVGDVTSSSSTTTTTTEIETEIETATTTALPYVTLEWDYYYTTIYWTYWFYYWTSYSPYTVRTVTSTITSTRSIWSVYATNSAVATSALSERSSSYSFRAPYSATSLESSTEPVTLFTEPTATARAAGSSDATDEATGSDTVTEGTRLDSATGAAVSMGVSGTGIMAAVLIAAVGGLAFWL
ncbi:uncharacterized protein N7479_001898 [Penicillium vulpinum]|uniref:Granulins domain-containing protein n=1 Tax=Penicillium vulpinum TaxID=29845 RepID=A0A1V6S3X4_9EURO|nr:uncharacterized protein N7479_001898 [Penicillium vulpinum]KAJ5971980.1 hypothetical protein N7479_001898 [Penicillium vulpinum]OQE08742.1 hypothetical protein PENVUL_c008G09120 [Penicillium vulpinum]